MGFNHIRAVALAAALFAAPLAAHEIGIMQVDGTFRKDGTYAIEMLVDLEHLPASRTVAQLAGAARVIFDGIPSKPPHVTILRSADARPLARVLLSGRTPPGVTQVSFSDDAVVGYFVVKFHTEGQPPAVLQWVDGGRTSTPLPLDRRVVPPTRWEVVRLYIGLGFTHILPRGLDHVLFVLGIFLLCVQLRPVLWQVSAFTVAHTITLALTIYGVVSLSPRIVEPLIALSIVYVAVENVFTSKLHAWRPVVVFCFGLLHGMGFAGVLTQIGLPRSEFIPALLSFNAGVECGQLTVIFAAFVLVGLPFRRRPWYRQRIVIPGSLLIAAVGLFWFIQRLAAAA